MNTNSKIIIKSGFGDANFVTKIICFATVQRGRLKYLCQSRSRKKKAITSGSLVEMVGGYAVQAASVFTSIIVYKSLLTSNPESWPKPGGKLNYFNVVGAGPLTEHLYTVPNGRHKREEWRPALAAFDRGC
jgi:hypothetical protein